MLGHSPIASVPISALQEDAADILGAVAFAGVGTFAASGIVEDYGAVAFNGVGTFAAAGDVVNFNAAVGFTGVGTFAASGVVHKFGSAGFAGVGSFALSGSFDIPAAVGFTGVGTLSAAGSLDTTGSISFVGVGSFLAAGYIFVGPYDNELVEFQAKIESAKAFIPAGLSTTIRPDALTFERRYAYSVGPKAIADVTETINSRPWYVRHENNTVYIAKANDTNTAWEPESVLFTYTGPEITELDLAFEQAARAVVVCERPTGVAGAPEVWLYWYDPTLIPPDFTFENKGPGRTPVCVLDNHEDITDSDVQVMYLKPGVGAVRLEQRDRYQTENTVPIPYNDNIYFEELAVTTGRRLAIIMSQRSPTSGRYSLRRAESLLYPVYPRDEYTPNVRVMSGELINTLTVLDLFDKDTYIASVDVASGSLVISVLEHSLYDKDTYTPSVSVASGILVVVVIEHTVYDKDTYEPGVSVVSGILVVTVIEHTLFDKDTYTPTVSVVSGILEPA